MALNWSEIKKWAKSHDLEPKKSKEGYYEFEDVKYESIDKLTTVLYNKITNNKWKEYQENYEKNSPKNN